MRGIAVVLVALHLDHAVLDDKQRHHALALHVVVNAQALAAHRPAVVGLALGFFKHHGFDRWLHFIRPAVEDAGNLTLMGKRTDANALVHEPVVGHADLADRIPTVFAQGLCIGLSTGGGCSKYPSEPKQCA